MQNLTQNTFRRYLLTTVPTGANGFFNRSSTRRKEYYATSDVKDRIEWSHPSVLINGDLIIGRTNLRIPLPVVVTATLRNMPDINPTLIDVGSNGGISGSQIISRSSDSRVLTFTHLGLLPTANSGYVQFGVFDFTSEERVRNSDNQGDIFRVYWDIK